MRLDAGGIEIQRVRIDVGKYGTRAGAYDGAARGEETERRRDDGIARLHASSGECEPQCVGTGGAADGRRRSDEGRDFALKGFDFGAEDEVLRSAHALDRGKNFFANLRVLPLQVEQRDSGQFGRGRRHWRGF